MEVIKYCQEQFSFELPNVTVACHTNNFLTNLCQCDNSVIKKVLCICNRPVLTMLFSFCSFYFYLCLVLLSQHWFVILKNL